MLLKVARGDLDFVLSKEQEIKLENESASTAVTFKVEANCSARFKVSPTVGVVRPNSTEVVSIKLRDNEASQPEDRFLFRTARYNEGDFASVKEFWAEAKRAPNVIPHEKLIFRVKSVTENSNSSANAAIEAKKDDALDEATLRTMQSFVMAPREEEVFDQDRRPNYQPEVDRRRGLDADEEEEAHIAAMILAAEKARQLGLENDEAQALMGVAEAHAQRGEHALAAAWFDEVNRILGQAQTAQVSVDVDEFALLCAKQDVTRIRGIARKDGSTTKDLIHPPSPPASPPPPPPPVQSRPSLSSAPTTLSSKRYAAPTESSLAHTRTIQQQQQLDPHKESESDRTQSVPRPSRLSTTSKTYTPGGVRRTFSSSNAVSPMASPVKRRISAPGSEFVLDIVPSPDIWPTEQQQRIILPSSEITVREMKTMILRTFRLNPHVSEQGVDLFIVGIRLSDHWRPADFGLRPGVTRVELRKKNVTRSKSTTTQGASAKPASTASIVVAASPSPSPMAGDELRSASRIDQLAQYESRVLELEEENARLKAELELRTRDLDVVSAKLLAITREKETAEIERDALAEKVASLQTIAIKSPTRRANSNNSLSAPLSPSTRSPKGSVGSKAFNVNALCVVAAPSFLIPDDEETEDYFEGGEENGPLLEGDQGDVAIDGHAFHFDSATSLSVIPPGLVFDRLLTLLPGDLFDCILDGASRTIIVLGETYTGKSAIMEGFDSLSNNSSPRNEGVIAIPNQTHKRIGLVETVAMQLYKSITAVTAESAIMGGELLTYTVEVSGFQTFRDGKVIDFLAEDTDDAPQECTKVLVPTFPEFDRYFIKMLTRKGVVSRRSDEPCRGDASDPDSCVVFTFEITCHASDGTVACKSRLRLIEACGTEVGGVTKNPLVGRIVEGEATVLAVLHPSSLHAKESVEVCTLALEMARRYETGSSLIVPAHGGSAGIEE